MKQPELGEIFQVGNKLMGRCAECGQIVRIDKPILGSLHICTEEPDQHFERHGDIETGWIDYKENK